MAPLDKQVVGITFQRGLNTQRDKRVLLPGELVQLQNASLSESDTIARRPGSTVIATGTAINTVAANANQLLAVDGNTLKGYVSATSLAAASAADNMSLATVDYAEVVHTTAGQDQSDVATLSGYTCYVWREFTAAGVISSVRVKVVDETTGQIVLAPTAMRSNVNVNLPRVMAVTGAFIILYLDISGPGTLYGRVIQISAPSTLGTETSLRTDVDTTTVQFDACGLGASAYAVYGSTTGAGGDTHVIRVDRSGATPSVGAGPLAVITGAQISVATGQLGAVAIASFSASLLGVYAVGNTGAAAGSQGLWAAVITSAVASSVAAARKDATAVCLNSCHLTAVLAGSTMYAFSDDYGRGGEVTASVRLIRRTGVDSGNNITSAAVTWQNSTTRTNGTNGPFLAGKAFVVDSVVYVPVIIQEYGSGPTLIGTSFASPLLQNSWFLLRDTGTSAMVAARALYGSMGVVQAAPYSVPSSPALSATSVIVLVGERTLLSFDSGTNVSPTGLSRFTLGFGLTAPLANATLGPVTVFANAILSQYDGAQPTESGFYLFPEVVTAATGGAGNVTAGVHQIVALYEWIDEAGQRHQSAPSVAIQYTAPGGAACTVTIPTLILSQKQNINIGVYATTVGGTIFYRLNAANSPVANSTSAATVTYSFNTSDANLPSGEILYTDGGALPNNSPPPASIICAHQNRLFIDVGDDPFAGQYSQPWVNGFGLQWNETLRFRVESTGGGLTAFASLDDKLIIFRPRKIGVLFGQGPNAAGLQNGYQLQDLPTDVGCSEPRSVLVMPEGVIFKSTSKGWYILGRDLQLRYIGEGVQEWDSQGVTSAVLMDTEHECRFTTNDASGLTLVYFYPHRPREEGRWGTYSNFTGVDAVWWPGGSAYVRATATKLIKELPPTSDGYAYGDEATTTTGGTGGTSPAPFTGSTIPITFRTGWLKPGEALQAFQRIWRVLFSGAVSGYPAPQTTLTSGVLAGATTLPVTSTAAFTADQLLGLGLTLGLGTANYEAGSDPYTITNSTTLELTVGCANAHNAGETVRGTPAFGAAGTMEVSFYFNGNDRTAYQTITVSDVSALVNGNAWDIRLQPNLQKCDSIMIKVVQTPATSDPGASLEFSGMTMEVGVKKGAFKLPSTKTYG